MVVSSLEHVAVACHTLSPDMSGQHVLPGQKSCSCLLVAGYANIVLSRIIVQLFPVYRNLAGVA